MIEMDNIIGIIQAYKEDNPHVIITDDMIKEIILQSIDKLVKEVKEEL